MGCIGSKEQGAAYRAPDEQLVANGGAAKLHGADATASATDTGGKAVVDPLPDATKPAQQQQQAQQSTQQEQEQQQQQQQQADEKAEAKPEPEFQSAPHPETEETRIATLHGLGVLDTPPEKRFDDITQLCCMIFKAPICLVSLVDNSRQWFKSNQGLPGVTETDRKSSFCAWTMLPHCPTVMVVQNALADVRFSTNPLVLGFPHIRFYAGAPLVASNGQRLGALCVIDTSPREFSAENCSMLANFGEMVVREIEKERQIQDQKVKNQELSEQKTKLIRAMNSFNEAIMLCDFSQPAWPIVFINEAWEQETGLNKGELTNTSFWQWFKLLGDSEAATATRDAYSQAVAKQQNFNMTVTYTRDSYTVLMLQFRCANNSNLAADMPPVAVPATQAMESVGAYGGQNPPSQNYYYTTIRNSMARQGTSSSTSVTSSASRSNKLFALEDAQTAFEDVQLGPMLGYGSFGRVYRGLWNGAPVAIKVLEHPAESDGPHGLEALLSSQISHPNVVRTFKHCTRPIPMARQGEGAEQLAETWMIMEFCNKGTLSEGAEVGWFRRNSSQYDVDYKALLATAKEVAAAMCYMHSLDILHADLTGSNILLCSSDADERGFIAKVADFGFSRVANTGDIKTKSYGAVSHTPPELLVSGVLSKAVDVYAFGVVLWEMYMGQRPYRGLTQAQVVNHISNKRGLSLNADCPPPLSRFILRCSSPKVEERPTFSQIMTELETLEEELV